MVQLRLPANSRITEDIPERAPGRRLLDGNARLSLDTRRAPPATARYYWIKMDQWSDGLGRSSRSRTRSIRCWPSAAPVEGVCLCSMNMNGDNGLACLEPLEKFGSKLTVYCCPTCTLSGTLFRSQPLLPPVRG